MNQDPAVRQEAHGILEGLFRNIGESRQAGEPPSALGGLGVDLAEFLTMPADLARLFTEMAFDLTELVLNALAEGGVILYKGLTPA
jgi:hypothetical protein